MPFKFDQKNCPNLHAGNYRESGPAEPMYDCIAWATGIDNDWWDPAAGRTWPGNAPRDSKVTSLVIVYEPVGFSVCTDGSLKAGVEKIAIYADGPYFEHAARQLESGKWTSKMGKAELIEHDAPENLEAHAMGR